MDRQPIDPTKGCVKPPYEIADQLDRAHSTLADYVAMTEVVLPGGTMQPNTRLTPKVLEDTLNFDPTKGRVTDPSEITTRLDQIYQT